MREFGDRTVSKTMNRIMVEECIKHAPESDCDGVEVHYYHDTPDGLQVEVGFRFPDSTGVGLYGTRYVFKRLLLKD